MCSLFGVIDYKEQLSQRWRNKAVTVLSRECEERGTDATGIAYNFQNSLSVFKRPLPAHKMKFHIPQSARTIMGHTRMTTQGNASHNYNNHPFIGNCGNTSFALAHNGVLWNDKRLRDTKKLPKTAIETDSYIAVQLIEQNTALDFDSLKTAVEQVKGSFTFTILDENNNLYFVKGDNPLEICHFKEMGVYLYASTKEIMSRTLKKLHLHHKVDERITLTSGDLLKVDSGGHLEYARFNDENFMLSQNSFLNRWRTPLYSAHSHRQTELDMLIEYASYMGVAPEDIALLFEYGYDEDEIEAMLYDPFLLRECLNGLPSG